MIPPSTSSRSPAAGRSLSTAERVASELVTRAVGPDHRHDADSPLEARHAGHDRGDIWHSSCSWPVYGAVPPRSALSTRRRTTTRDARNTPPRTIQGSLDTVSHFGTALHQPWKWYRHVVLNGPRHPPVSSPRCQTMVKAGFCAASRPCTGGTSSYSTSSHVEPEPWTTSNGGSAFSGRGPHR